MEGFGWALSAPPSQLAPALTLLAELVEQPALADAALETERTVALAGLAQLRDDMSRQPSKLALAAAFGDHRYAYPTLGTTEGLERCDTAALRAWHERRVRRGHCAVVIVADAPPDEVAAAVRGAFRSLAQSERRTAAPIAWPADAREAMETRDKAQSALALLLPGPRRDDPRRYAAALLSTVASGLGGRFFETLRDRDSLAYSVHLASRTLQCAGWMLSYLACAPAKEDAARAGLLREWARLAAEPVTPEELARAKAYSLGALAIRQQNAASVLSDIADAWLFGTLAELEEEPRAIARLSAGDLHAVARDSFDPARAVWGIVRGRQDT